MEKIIILALILCSIFAPIKATIAQAPNMPEAPVQQMVEQPAREKTVDELLVQYFGKQAPFMKAIFMAESKMNPKAKNWNCQYTIFNKL